MTRASVRRIGPAVLLTILSPVVAEFLLGDFSIADCMYFPVAARFRTHGVTLPERSAAYCRALFERPHARELEELARAAPPIPEYDAALVSP